MNQAQGSNCFPWSEWMESAANVWLSAAQSWQELPSALADSSRTGDYMQASLSMWKAFLKPWTGEAGETRQPSFDMLEALSQVLGSGGLSQEMVKWLWNQGEVTGGSFEKLRHEAALSWNGIYEKGIQPFLKMPQVGLTRVYKEKINRLADKFNAYQAAVSEFQIMLSGPMEKSFADMKGELDRHREKGESADDFKVYYSKWIQGLENHYMSLFRSDEYRRSLAGLLSETAAFRVTGNEVLTEMLEFLPIPTNKEMDEVYKELYTLKKLAKETAKKMSKIESAMGEKDIG
ncbi:putative PhaE [Syntrophobacter sp. SbD1]|nr:putative PhaE [Syntrophobacter sp. SbD1]